MSHAVAIDIGGTFTDLVAFNRAGERVVYTKSPTTYGDFAEGILDCFRKAGIALSDVDLIHHGTTLVINTLIQRSAGRTALVTTRGFRDVLEIARGNRPAPLDLYYQRDEPLIARDFRFEVSERIGSDCTAWTASRSPSTCAKPALNRWRCSFSTPTSIRRTKRSQCSTCGKPYPGSSSPPVPS